MCWSLERVALSILVLYMPLIQYVVALAVMEAVKSVCDKKVISNSFRCFHGSLISILTSELKIINIRSGTSTYRSKKFNVSAEGILVACLKEKNFLVPSFINLKCSLIYSCTEGLTSSGYLLAIGDDNQMYELHPDGNRSGQKKTMLQRFSCSILLEEATVVLSTPITQLLLASIIKE
ncbi:putative biotin--protein ligase-like isoform X2 [Raphanus sativus]|nr:putative biotin--protein ligase-like isoform X2 [Raphanus sativus]